MGPVVQSLGKEGISHSKNYIGSRERREREGKLENDGREVKEERRERDK